MFGLGGVENPDFGSVQPTDASERFKLVDPLGSPSGCVEAAITLTNPARRERTANAGSSALDVVRPRVPRHAPRNAT